MKLRIILACCLLFIYCNSNATTTKYCLPTDPCWPSSSEWDALNNEVHGHLQKGASPLDPCYKTYNSSQCEQALTNLKNPFYIESQSGGTQSIGWYKQWQAQISPYVVAAESAEDIVSAVKFANKHHIKMVVKATGHDYLGRSNSADSLLIWTHNMRNIQVHDRFVPTGCPKTQTGIPAMSAAAGNRWLEAYGKVMVEKGRYVQGGGCTSVGVAGGFLQGGGFGSFSKKFGTGAAGLLEAEVITAEGKIVTANNCQNADLFWALKGGGGGTYGIVSRVTLATHDLPLIFGAVEGTVKANSDNAFKELISYFILYYRNKLHNEHWGEQVIFTPNNELQLAMVFQGMNKVEVDALWEPFKNWLKALDKDYQFTVKSIALPAQKFWDYEYLSKNLPDYIVIDNRQEGTPGKFWWIGNQGEVSIYLTHYQSMYLPYRLFSDNNSAALSKALFDASRLTRLSLHFNKGLSGAPLEVINRQKQTAMSQEVLDAAALVTISGGQQYAFPNLPEHQLDLAKAKLAAENANKAINIFRSLSPNSGTYSNEADYNLENWQQALWGENYSKLLSIKKKYDPNNVFHCHHCVGSE